MERTLLPHGVRAGDDIVRFQDIYTHFAATPYGKTLRQGIRFGSFKPQDMSNEEWRKLLGPDVNNLEHLWLTYGLTRSFLRSCLSPPPQWKVPLHPHAQFTQEESEALLLGAVVHDWGEAVTGDIEYMVKSQDDEDQEFIALQHIITTVITQEDIRDKALAIVGEIVQKHAARHSLKPFSKLQRAFEAIERLGYYRTGLRAWEHHTHMNGHQILANNLRCLGAEVASNHTLFLLNAAETYPPVAHYLAQERARIAEVLAADSAIIFTGHPSHDSRLLAQRHERARETWRNTGVPPLLSGEHRGE